MFFNLTLTQAIKISIAGITIYIFQGGDRASFKLNELRKGHITGTVGKNHILVYFKLTFDEVSQEKLYLQWK